jgi:hypothetical protein
LDVKNRKSIGNEFMRKRRKISHPSQNLDSFLDILTNTVGVLMFISLFVSLLAVESGNVIKTPLVSNTNKNPLFFEVRDNKVMYIDTQKVQNELNKMLSSFPECVAPNMPDNVSPSLYDFYLRQYENYRSCVLNKERYLRTFQTNTDYYSVSFLDLNALIYEPRNDAQGESMEEITREGSKFQRLLTEIDNQSNYLAFIVRPDSFNGFRLARAKALEVGFDVGWEPSETEIPIIFGSGGRSIGVQ